MRKKTGKPAGRPARIYAMYNDVSVNELMRQCAEYALGDMERGEDDKNHGENN